MDICFKTTCGLRSNATFCQSITLAAACFLLTLPTLPTLWEPQPRQPQPKHPKRQQRQRQQQQQMWHFAGRKQNYFWNLNKNAFDMMKREKKRQMSIRKYNLILYCFEIICTGFEICVGLTTCVAFYSKSRWD